MMTYEEIYENRSKNIWMLTGLASTQIILSKQLGIGSTTLGNYGRRDQEVTDQVARLIEVKLKKPYCWMDRPNYSMDLTAEEWAQIKQQRSSANESR